MAICIGLEFITSLTWYIKFNTSPENSTFQKTFQKYGDMRSYYIQDQDNHSCIECDIRSECIYDSQSVHFGTSSKQEVSFKL